MARRGISTVAALATLLASGPSPALAAEPLTLTARLSSAGEAPPVVTSGSGTAQVVINAARTQLTYRITYRRLSGPLTVAAFCVSWLPSLNACAFIGPGLTLGSSPLTGTLAIAPGQVDTWLSAPPPWVQLGTSKYPSGEIRGPLLALPATSTLPPSGSGSADWRILLLCAAGAAGGWLSWRRHQPGLRSG